MTATTSEAPAAERGRVSARAVLAAVREALGARNGPVALHEPELAGREWDYVRECLDTGWVSSVGSFVNRFEAELAETCGVAHAIAVVNGTAALHLALEVAGVRAGDEVLVPALTFVATANAVSHCGAVPHFVDSEWRTLGLDPTALAEYLATTLEPTADGPRNRGTGRAVRAIVPMHVFGHTVDMDAVAEVAAHHGLVVVEDAAEALGSTYRGRPAGSLSAIAALSFNGNKIVTAGGGGALLTDDKALADRARHLSTTAKVAHAWEFRHDAVAYNYRLPNLNAALGCAQLQRLPSFLERKRRLAARYEAAFAHVDGARVFVEPAHGVSNYWLNTLVLDERSAPLRDTLLEATNAEGFMTRPAWTPMHRLPMYQDCPRAPLPVTEAIAARVLNLPSSAVLGDA